MNVVFTLDYEVYFGRATGTVERCLVEPAEALARVAHRHGVPLVFFVDAGHLVRLRELGTRHPSLMADHDRIARQLSSLAAAGHEIQLHVHPHWQDAHWDGQGWVLDLRRYRLHDFAAHEASEIVAQYTQALRSLIPGAALSAYRAGGWCLQPFSHLREPLRAAGICIDSSVFAGGRQRGSAHDYDFSRAPDESRWFFDHDPLVPDEKGAFLEVPIASHDVSPLFFWRLALARRMGRRQHRPLGDGSAMPLGRADLARKLLAPSASVVSIDGLKASYLEAAFQAYRQRQRGDFVVIGHPKALTRFGLKQFDNFLHDHPCERYVGLESYRSLFERRQARRQQRPPTPMAAAA